MKWLIKQSAGEGEGVTVLLSVCFCAGAAQSVGRRSLGMRLAAGAAKRRRSSTTSPTSCRYPTASALTWTRPPSWGWPSASCAHASCSPQVRRTSEMLSRWIHDVCVFVFECVFVCWQVGLWLIVQLSRKVFVGSVLFTPSSRLI